MAESLGLEAGIVRLIEYDPRWSALLAAEQRRIRGRCTLALRLEHVGGTSIPGMCAKPVQDREACMNAKFGVRPGNLRPAGGAP